MRLTLRGLQLTRCSLLSVSAASSILRNIHFAPTRMTTSPGAAAHDVVQLAAAFSLSSGIAGGWILPPLHGESASTILLKRSTRDFDGKGGRAFVQTHKFDKDGVFSGVHGFPLELSGAVIFSVSPSGGRLAIVRDSGDGAGSAAPGGPKPYVVELWDRSAGHGLISRIPTFSAHEKIMGDKWFGGFAWAPDESRAVYVAQKPAPKTRSFFTCDPANAAAAAGEQYVKRDDWGEKYDGVSELSLFLVDFDGGFVAELPGLPAGRTPGQPAISPDGGSVVYTSWTCEPRKLGMIYCYQRPCQLWSAPFGDWADALRAQHTDVGRAAAAAVPASGDAAAGGSSPEHGGAPAAATAAAAAKVSAAAAAGNGAPPSLPQPVHRLLTPSACLSRCPRFSPTGSSLAWLANEAGFDTHGGCFQLKIADWDAAGALGTGEGLASARTLVDVVELPESEGAFPGLWLDNLPESCWQPDGSGIFLTSSWGSADAVLRVDAHSGAIVRVTAAEAAAAASEADSSAGHPGGPRAISASTEVLCVGQDGILVAASSPNAPGGVGIVPFSAAYTDLGACIRGRRLGRLIPTTTRVPEADVAAAEAAVAAVRWRILSLAPEGEPAGSAAARNFEAILMEPPPPRETAATAAPEARLPLPPLLVVPHGGPHGVLPAAFFPSYAFLTALRGFAVLFVNYRGSTGFGAAALASLPGRIGTADVADVAAATRAALALRPAVADANRIGVVGGSHGGFLGAHLTAQHPELFRAAALRNPVTDVASMASASDIPDWCFIEALGAGSYDFDAAEPPTAEQLARMRAVSPIAHAASVRAPTLMCLGAKDRRVPAFQGRSWHYMLKGRGVPTKLIEYPEDVHAIDKPASEADHWLHIGRWCEEHLS